MITYGGRVYAESETKWQLLFLKYLSNSKSLSLSVSHTHTHKQHIYPEGYFPELFFLIYLCYIDYEFCKITQIIFRTRQNKSK